MKDSLTWLNEYTMLAKTIYHDAPEDVQNLDQKCH